MTTTLLKLPSAFFPLYKKNPKRMRIFIIIGDYMLTGDSDDMYSASLTSPEVYMWSQHTLTFYLAHVHLHPYSASYVSVIYTDDYRSQEVR